MLGWSRELLLSFEILILISIYRKGPHDPTAVSIADIAKSMNMHKSSVRRMLKRRSFHPYRVTHKRQLTELQKERRRVFCRIWKSLTPAQRRMLVWTDETYITLKVTSTNFL